MAITQLTAIHCPNCGGSIRAVPGKPIPACVFCGAEASDLVEQTIETEPPDGFLAFVCSAERAKEAFVTFASSSFWYPSDLRRADLSLKPVLLGAWSWSGDLETHYTALVESTSSDSGKRPIAKQEKVNFDQVLVIASSTLRQSELRQLGRFDENALQPFDPDSATDPFEISSLTRDMAREAAQDEMRLRHVAALEANNLDNVCASSIASNLQGRPVLVPVFIGTYPYGKKNYRVLVHGQTGDLIGEAPYSAAKIAGVVLLIFVVIPLIIAAIIAATTGTTMLLGAS